MSLRAISQRLQRYTDYTDTYSYLYIYGPRKCQKSAIINVWRSSANQKTIKSTHVDAFRGRKWTWPAAWRHPWDIHRAPLSSEWHILPRDPSAATPTRVKPKTKYECISGFNVSQNKRHIKTCKNIHVFAIHKYIELIYWFNICTQNIFKHYLTNKLLGHKTWLFFFFYLFITLAHNRSFCLFNALSASCNAFLLFPLSRASKEIFQNIRQYTTDR